MVGFVPKGGIGGPRFPTNEEWKEAIKLRLEEIGWSYSELARQLGVTPAAITHLFAKATSSTLRPRIEDLLGWPEHGPHAPGQFPAGTARTAATEPTDPKATARNNVASGQLAELISYFQALNPENKVRVIERAHTLWEGEGGPPDSPPDSGAKKT